MPLVTVGQLAKEFKVCERTVFRQIKAGLPTRKVGRSLRFDLAEVRRWSKQQKAAPTSGDA